MLFSAISLLALVFLIFAGQSDAARNNGDRKQFSYLCAELDQELCLGISPGHGEPAWDSQNIFQLQVKSRSGAETWKADYKKTRWDLSYDSGKVSLSRFPGLCASKDKDMNDFAGLFPCRWALDSDTPYNGVWLLDDFQDNTNGAGLLQLNGTDQCLTIMKCASHRTGTGTEEDEDWCDKDSNEVAWNEERMQVQDARRGSYLRLRPCYNTPGGNPNWAPLQIFRQNLDCAVGCQPAKLLNDKCDKACDNEACNYDDLMCIPTFYPTKSPAPDPTKRPRMTKAPVTKAPVRGGIKVSKTPTSSPTITCPSAEAMAYCGRFPTEKRCMPSANGATGGGSRRSRKRSRRRRPRKFECTWCHDSCLPSGDDRACSAPGVYDHCQHECPTEVQMKQCFPTTSMRFCLRQGGRRRGRRKPCTFCRETKSCHPGRNMAVCRNDKIYAHCGDMFRPRCPKYGLVMSCGNADEETCQKRAKCEWCPSATESKCRPKSAQVPDICSVKGNPILTQFSHCTKLVARLGL